MSPKVANSTLDAYWLLRVKAQGKQEVPRQGRDPTRMCGCSIGIVRDMGGGQHLPLCSGQILHGCLKGYMEGTGLYPEGTGEAPKGFKRGDVRPYVLEGSCWLLYEGCPREARLASNGPVRGYCSNPRKGWWCSHVDERGRWFLLPVAVRDHWG